MESLLKTSRCIPTSLRLLAAGLAVIVLSTSVIAAENDAADLRAAFTEAARTSKSSDDLDPGYELLGIAETAQKRGLTQLAEQAGTAFAELVKRASTRALKAGGAAAEDALGQFVDLRFMAKSAGLPLPQSALDDAMTTLFPPVTAAIQKRFDQAAEWDNKLQAAEDLAELQASATQVMNETQAGKIGAGFNDRAAQLEQLAGADTNAETRTAMLTELERARKSRDDRVIDAKANNLNVVAALLAGKTGTDAGFRAPSEVDVPEELAAGTRSCIETGFSGKQDPVLLRTMQVNCINSGRLPAQGRCPITDLSFLCYDAAPGGEKMTFVYRGTPEELYFQRKCGQGKLMRADEIPAGGASFRATNLALAFTCAPAAQ